VPGIVTSLTAQNTDYVEQGRVMVELDKTDATIALDRSVSELGNAVRTVMRLFEEAKQYQAMISMKKAIFIKTAQDYDHREALVDEGGVSLEDYQHAEADLQAAYADLIATEHLYIAAAAQVENTTVEDHPLVAEAKNRVRDAFVFLERCTIEAPVSGIVAQRAVQVGEQVSAGEPLLAIVPLDQMWIDANFKEVQLSKMRIGQPAKVTVDLWGSDVVFKGTVVGIGGGTGSIFSVLPPQNATGNWIKIVQRIPVRINLDPAQILKFPLRLGLSTEVTVDLHNLDMPMVPATQPEVPIYETDVFADQELGAEPLIDEVIRANLSPTFLEDNPAP
jgi:membrane fusion protein (multidrug efflux system)